GRRRLERLSSTRPHRTPDVSKASSGRSYGDRLEPSRKLQHEQQHEPKQKQKLEPAVAMATTDPDGARPTEEVRADDAAESGERERERVREKSDLASDELTSEVKKADDSGSNISAPASLPVHPPSGSTTPRRTVRRRRRRRLGSFVRSSSSEEAQLGSSARRREPQPTRPIARFALASSRRPKLLPGLELVEEPFVSCLPMTPSEAIAKAALGVPASVNHDSDASSSGSLELAKDILSSSAWKELKMSRFVCYI
ncbi:unnamed protein product, partial [Protopolystoma xenopodis]